MKLSRELMLLFGSQLGISAHAFVDYGTIHPVKFQVGATHAKTSMLPWTNSSVITLTRTNPVVTLDFGHEVAGFPYVINQSPGAETQLEFKYAESFVSLDSPFADGPWTFSNGLSNSFRVETFNLSKSGRSESFFVQGGQRWMTVELLTDKDLVIEEVGFRATSQNIDADKLPGTMNTSNALYSQIFDLGGCVSQAACVDAGNAPSTWEITSDGALVRGQTSAQSALGVSASNYTISFDTKIVRGGTGWRIASAVEPLGPYFVLTADYTTTGALVNTNRTLLPPNTIAFNGGWSLVNQSTLLTPDTQYFPVTKSIEEGKWYRISTSIQESGYKISLDGEQIAFIPLPPFFANRFSSPSRYEGTWGFGSWQDHVTYYKNVSVVAKNGTEIYRNAMTSEGVLAEYNVAPLAASVCLDGAKRDRLVWTGDFYHTVRVVAQSSARFDQLLGSIKYVFEYQNKNSSSPYDGFVPISPKLGSRPQYYETGQSYDGLIDYQDLFLAGIGEYFRYNGDVEGVRAVWPNVKRLAASKLKFIDPTSGLISNTPEAPRNAWFLGPANGSAVTGLFAFTLDKLTLVADGLGDVEASATYQKAANGLRASINKQLWNEEIGTYSLSTESRGNFSLTGVAWALLANAANATQTASAIAKLEALRFGVGYKTISSDAETPDYELAPNPSGFLLEALFQARRDYNSNSTPAITHLLDNLWGSMVNNDNYASGASWEYVKPDGSPGIDLFTSLAHPWGAAPTYVLPEYLLGVQPSSPGYKTFALRPLLGYLSLDEVHGKVPTPRGPIEVGWTVRGRSVVLVVSVPEGVSGTLEVPDNCRGKMGKRSGRVELRAGVQTFELEMLS
ncbi:Six-hairpin glycosidase-like protein [Phaeosphaeria sp. MPI-PUGE-AT-0046c]|nr:Six-hairpin glycosidase-like protein [Phaeosphaeria sp. MPI-PUGE-AT-0046c]